MIVNFRELDERQKTVFISLISGIDSEFWESVKGDEEKTVDVDIRFNGVEANFMNLVGSFTRNLDHMVERRVQEQVEKKLDETIGKQLSDYSTVIYNSRRELCKALGLQTEQDE